MAAAPRPSVSSRAGRAAAATAVSLVAACVLALVFAAFFTAPPAAVADSGGGGCLSCHEGIEDMHPWAAVTCVQCHGGDARATRKEDAHVAPRGRPPGDERVMGQQWDLEATRFADPGNLRVAAQSCGPCHARAVDDTLRSLHATTAGHLGDGLYENGVVADRHPPVSVFNVRDLLPDDAQRPAGAVSFLRQIAPFAGGADRSKLASHFADLPRKACMQCHLWSEGRAVRGRAGMDGDYRGEGCSACHVPYADDGLSQSKDASIDHFEPGHPREHRMVRSPPTDVCVRCHYGDASIGLSFRGLAQAVPGMPQSPDAPGLHRKRLNGVYYISDPAATPPDVHHQRGMHCVDCHGRHDTMGDGHLYRRMEDQVEIRCETCHGTSEAYATGITARGTRLAHLETTADGMFLRSRVDGKLRRVKQARDIVKPGSPDFNAAAANAMTVDHARLACHSCHSGWNPNFFGFHFDRNEAFDQLDLLSGARTPGRVTTQEKVFSTFKAFYAGWDSHGRLSPYMVGFSSMATIHDKTGAVILDQELPVTRAGLSGMTMIHHQTHTTTARARQCAECHRSAAALGRGSADFRLAREFLVSGGDAGVRILAFDRKTPANSAVVASLPLANVRAVAYLPDRLTGRASWMFAASATEGLVVVDVSSPGFPRIAERLGDACTSPEALLVAATRLYVADGALGLKVFDIANPSKPKLIGTAPVPAFGLELDGPNLYVAAGLKGLAVVDVRRPEAPKVLHPGFQPGSATSAADCRSVATMFQPSRPHPDLLEGPRSKARNVAAVGTTQQGVFLFDVTEPDDPRPISRVPGAGMAASIGDVAVGTVYELGSEGGAIPSRERDILFVGHGSPVPGVSLFDVSDPVVPQFVGTARLAEAPRSIRVLRAYNPPFLQSYVVAAHRGGVQMVDVSRPSRPAVAASVPGAPLSISVDLEEFPLDRAVDADGRPILDVSHEGARWLDQREFLRVLAAPLLQDTPAPGAPR